jgi:DinB superfamily
MLQLQTVKDLITNQFEAALSTLNACIDKCPEAAWNEPVVNLKFCQAAFHTLFYTDYYLGQTEEDFRKEPFHRENAHVFRDYEELEPRAPVLLYEKPWIKTYLHYCRTRCRQVIAAETAEMLAAKFKFPRKDFSRAEGHIYNIRHVQHHAAQLIMRLRLDFQAEFPWFGSGWKEG